MNDKHAETRSIIIERKMPHPPEKVWRALTQSELIAEWLMPNDFDPRPGACFAFRSKPMGDWNGVVHCEITAFEPPRRLAYSWKGGATPDLPRGVVLDSLVEWTLMPVAGGTLVRMEHSGFGPCNASAYDAMSGGWPHVLERLEQVAAAR